MNNMWFGKVYYMFGFLFLCYAIMIITTAAVTVLLVYFLLCAENYHWQWRAFSTAGASAGYVFANALLYWISKLSFGSFTSGVLYVGYSLLVSFLFFILTGMCHSYSLDLRFSFSCRHVMQETNLMYEHRDDRLLQRLDVRATDLFVHQDRLKSGKEESLTQRGATTSYQHCGPPSRLFDGILSLHGVP